MAAHQLAAGKKMSPFSFSAVRLFQRKKKQNKNNLCVWGTGGFYSFGREAIELRSGSPGYELAPPVEGTPQQGTHSPAGAREWLSITDV